jgi:hypothetical protein
MAVVVQCFHCNAVLELDEGFRGGVCRCSACGALLEVPRAQGSSKTRVRPASPSAVPRPKPVAPSGSATGSSSPPGSRSIDMTGLSSGLAGIERTRPVAPAREIIPPVPPPLQTMASGPARRGGYAKWIWLGILLLVLIAGVVMGLIYWGMNQGAATIAGPAPKAGGKVPTAAGSASPVGFPMLAGIQLSGKRIIISMDSASSMGESFDYLRRGILRAVEEMDPAQQITVVLWTETGIKTLPRNAFVTSKTSKALRDLLESTTPSGASNAEVCIRSTVGLIQGADQVLLITAKSELPPVARADAFLRQTKPGAWFDVIRITPGGSAAMLETLANATGGKYVAISPADLDLATR